MEALEADDKQSRLPIDKCREILGEDGKLMTDQQVQAFRDAIYTIVDNVLDNYLRPDNVYVS